MTINIREGSVINNSSVLFVPTVDSKVHYKYVGKILARKPSNFTGVAVVVHVYTYGNKYLFTTAGFVNGFKFRSLKFQGINIGNTSILHSILAGALDNILNSQNGQYSELRKRLIDYFQLDRFLPPDSEYLSAYFDYYVYKNDKIVGLYRLVRHTAYTFRSEPEPTNDGLYESKFLLNFETGNDLTFKLFDTTGEQKTVGYEQFQAPDTALCVEASASSNQLSLSSYFKLEGFKLSLAKGSLLRLVFNEVAEPVAFCKVSLHYKDYDRGAIEYNIKGLRRSGTPLSSNPELVLPFIFCALSAQSDLIDVGGAFARAYSTIVKPHDRLVPLTKADLLDIDGGIAISQYDEYIERHKKHGIGLYGKVYFSDQCVIVGINLSNKVRKIYGYYFTSGSANRDIFLCDTYATRYLVKPFSGYFVNLERRNPGLQAVTVSSNDTMITLTDIVRSKSKSDMRFNIHMVNYNVFRTGDADFIVTKVTEPFEINQVYLAYVETSFINYVPTGYGYDSKLLDTICSLYVTCPHVLHTLPDNKSYNFATMLKDDKDDIASNNNFLVSYVISSNAFDVSGSYAPITASYLNYSPHNSLFRMYDVKYNNDSSKYGPPKHIPAVEIKHLVVDSSIIFEKLVKASCSK